MVEKMLNNMTRTQIIRSGNFLPNIMCEYFDIVAFVCSFVLQLKVNVPRSLKNSLKRGRNYHVWTFQGQVRMFLGCYRCCCMNLERKYLTNFSFFFVKHPLFDFHVQFIKFSKGLN